MKKEVQNQEQYEDYNSCVYFGGETNPGYIFCLNANMPIDERACKTAKGNGADYCMGFQLTKKE